MPNKKTVALTQEQYKSIIKVIKEGFTVPVDIYNYIKMYCLENNIRSSARIPDYSY